ncbi:hypothetical protein F503_02118 [Ophiostoma piceae UAMH 11346]|uniref:Uncharacterized protein n=1 Tax=Ophiostoma piceae (strain UAMH 11346) TaxID=1262450 RepID=S3BVU9_OPHP1|nr:hypothetical protein F503_02118 [Ophiostoma piceae UAMH 11346]
MDNTSGVRRGEWHSVPRDSVSDDAFSMAETMAPVADPAPAAGRTSEADAAPMSETMSSQPAGAAEELRRETERLRLLLGRMENLTFTGTVTTSKSVSSTR